MQTLDAIFDEWIGFSVPLFKGASAIDSLNKLMEEADEVATELGHGHDGKDLVEEYADCFMCLIHSMAKAGITVPQFKKAFSEKFAKNKERDWARNVNGTYSHIKK